MEGSMILEKIDADLIEPHRLAECAIDHLLIEQRLPPEDRMSITPREALAVLAYEADFVAVCAANQAMGIELTDRDREALSVSVDRINTIKGFAHAPYRRR
jgi:hypothetical protein